jgi:LPXTG-motif cell wall-anchored protein
VTHRYARGALILVVVVVLSAPAVLAKSAGRADARAPSAAAARMAQGDPRDPFDRGDSGAGADADADAGAGAEAGTGATASQSGVTGAGTLPLTGSTTTLLVGVAGGLLLVGGLALWMTRYRPRHAGYRPRHAR